MPIIVYIIVKSKTTVCSIGFISGIIEKVIPPRLIPYIFRSCIFYLCLLFPNTLYHQVYPFQGSGERRSIAFNMTYKGFKKDSGIQIAGDSINLYNETHHADTIPWRRLEK